MTHSILLLSSGFFVAVLLASAAPTGAAAPEPDADAEANQKLEALKKRLPTLLNEVEFFQSKVLRDTDSQGKEVITGKRDFRASVVRRIDRNKGKVVIL